MIAGDDGLISVQYGPTNDVYDALVHADNAISDVITQLEGVINPLIGTWEGISADAWQSLQQNWTNMIAQMNADLGKNAGILSEMTSNYGTTDNNLSLQWQEITLS
jgi:WXG100 family type VII secretion target